MYQLQNVVIPIVVLRRTCILRRIFCSLDNAFITYIHWSIGYDTYSFNVLPLSLPHLSVHRFVNLRRYSTLFFLLSYNNTHMTHHYNMYTYVYICAYQYTSYCTMFVLVWKKFSLKRITLIINIHWIIF